MSDTHQQVTADCVDLPGAIMADAGFTQTKAKMTDDRTLFLGGGGCAGGPVPGGFPARTGLTDLEQFYLGPNVLGWPTPEPVTSLRFPAWVRHTSELARPKSY